ncbi:MAG: hypothetical protein JW849_08265 [Phycisphaerae bacterium]|nr:hypothetical protein [Phycisphaerae bacterium]
MLTACVAACLAVLPAWGQDEEEGKIQAVKLKDGRTFQGVVTRRDDGIEVKTKGGELKFQEDQIESIQPVVPAKDEYLARRDAADLNSAEARYTLARWVWEHHQNDKTLLLYARDDLKAALEIQKSYTRAILLLRQVEAKIRVLDAAVAAASRRPGEALAVEDRDLVTEQDIFRIRLMELRETDRVMIQYKNKVLKRYIDSMRGRETDGWDLHGKEQHFLARPRSVQVMEILRNKPNDVSLQRDIHVMRDPKFMTDFRTHVWPIIQNHCAAANCHGGPTPNGGLKFFVMPGLNPRADYTNFLIVSGWEKGKNHLLDRQNIEASLILQYGLNRKVAEKRHPVEIPPIFTGIRSPNYRRVYNWMSSLRKPIAPNYDIHSGFRPAGMTLDTSGKPKFYDEMDQEGKDKAKPAEKDAENVSDDDEAEAGE